MEPSLEPSPKLTRFLPLLGIGLYALVAFAAWVDPRWHPEWDGAIYLLTGGSLARGEGYLYQGEPFFLRPPGMSWLLSHFWSEEGYDPLAVHRFLMAWAVAAVAAIYWAVSRSHPRWLALAVALLSGTSAIFTGAFNSVLSEFPFLALFFAGVALLSPRRLAAPDSEPAAPLSWPAVLAAAACLAAALYLRTVAILVLPGVLLLGWRVRAQRGRVLVALALVAALGAPWILFAGRAAAAAEVPSEQLFLHDYATALFRVDPGDPESDLVDFAGWRERIAKNGRKGIEDLARLVHLDRVPSRGAPVAQGLLLLLALLGYGLALRRGPTLLEWLAPVYTALVLTYFTYAVRLMAPLAPLLYLYVLLAVQAIAGALGRGLGRPRAASLASVLVASGLLIGNGSRLDVPRPLGPGEEDLLAIGTWLRENTPPHAGILCNQAPILEQISGRRCYTFRFLRRLQLLGRYDIDYVVFDQRQKELLRAVSEGPTEAQTIRTPNGARIPVFRIVKK